MPYRQGYHQEHVYEVGKAFANTDRSVCTASSAEDAKLIVTALNAHESQLAALAYVGAQTSHEITVNSDSTVMT